MAAKVTRLGTNQHWDVGTENLNEVKRKQSIRDVGRINQNDLCEVFWVLPSSAGEREPL